MSLSLKRIKQVVREMGGVLAPKLMERMAARSMNKTKGEIESILNSPGPTDTTISERDFGLLQSRYPKPPEYGYDPMSKWRRGLERALLMGNLHEKLREKLSVLEVACGDGTTGLVMSTYGHSVTLADMDDWRDEWAKPLPFFKGMIEDGLPLGENSVDFVYSFNAFEHLNNPETAMKEILRVCRSDALIYLDFGPLYCSPYGLHAGRSLYMPFPQFLFSDTFINDRLAELGVYDLGRVRTELQPLNRWKAGDFMRLWKECGLSVLLSETTKSYSPLGLVKEYPASFRGRGLGWEDLITCQLRVLLQVKGKTPAE